MLLGTGGGIQSIAGNDLLIVNLFQVSALNFRSYFDIFGWNSVIKCLTIRTHSGGSGGKLGSGTVMLGLQWTLQSFMWDLQTTEEKDDLQKEIWNLEILKNQYSLMVCDLSREF